MKEYIVYSKKGHTIRIMQLLTIGFILVVFLLLVLFPRAPENLQEYAEKRGMDPIVFSVESGSYPSGLSLELTAPGPLPRGAFLCYTLDGTEPTPESPRYEGPVKLPAPGEPEFRTADEARDSVPVYFSGADYSGEHPASGTTVYTVRARIFCRSKTAPENGETEEDGTAAGAGGTDLPEDQDAAGKTAASGDTDASLDPAAAAKTDAPDNLKPRIIRGYDATDVQYGVYCLGEGLFPCGEDLVVCVDADPADLYDYDTGILVGGRDFDENGQSKYYGNYMKKGDEWVRSCHVSIFDGEGNLMTDCNAGLAVSGGMSRRYEQKALNLSFGDPFGEDGEKLALDVFPDQPAADCAHVGSYTHLRLRARNQVPRSFRESLVSELAAGSGSRLVTSSRNGIIFLNGRFYTLADLSPTFSSSLLAHRFDLPDTKKIEKHKGKEVSVFRKMGVTDLFAADLTVEENRRALEAAVDMDDYLLYYAVNVLDNNLDWPRNNLEAWRYTGEYDPARPYTDGRLRFMVYDSDKIYNTDESEVETFGTDNFVSMMENTRRGYESRFRDVMKADDYRNRFVTILCDLMNTSFETDHVLNLLQEIFSKGEAEYKAYFTPEYMEKIEEDYAAAQTGAAARNDMIRTDLQTWFGLSDTYSLNLEASSGVSVTWNNMYVGPGADYTCDYYRGVPIAFTATASPGWRFDHWEINGEETEGNAQTFSVSSAAGTCRVRAVAVPVEGERLVLAEVSSAGEEDWIRLYNAGTTAVDTGRYCISDTPDRLRLFRLPKSTLQPGESCLINGSRNNVEGALCTCNFSISRDETLFLTPDDGTGLPGDSLRVPCMSNDCSYGRRDNGGIFCWFDNRWNER